MRRAARTLETIGKLSDVFYIFAAICKYGVHLSIAFGLIEAAL